jgi:hypothetical protein
MGKSAAARPPVRQYSKGASRTTGASDWPGWDLDQGLAGSGDPAIIHSIDQLRLPIIRRNTYQNINAMDANNCIAAET